MKYILSKDKRKMTEVRKIEIEFIRIPVTDKAKLYEDCKLSIGDLPMPEGLDYEIDYCMGIEVLVNSIGNKIGESYGQYKLDNGIQEKQINQLMEKIIKEETIILPSQEEFEKIRGDIDEK